MSSSSGDQHPGSALGSGMRPRSGRPLCWYGGACRKLHDRAHCAKYDHQMRPCKFGAKCRRKGRGCRYQHPEAGEHTTPFLDALFPGRGGDLFVDSDSATNETNDPERPVPFIFLLVCVCAAGLVVLPVLGACKAAAHQAMFHLGCALLAPLLLLQLLLHTRRAWVLERFLAGDFSEKAAYRRLGLLWYPDPLQALRYLTGDVAGNSIEQYATWETNDTQELVEYAHGGNRDGGQVTAVTSGFEVDFPGEFSGGGVISGGGVTLDAQGNLQGLSVEVRFDGSFIASDGGAWSKAGYWRLDWVTKVLLLLFTLGVECIFVAVSMPPGVGSLGERMPLNAVFVVDGSASIGADMWRAQQKAGQKFIKAFQRTYGSKGGDLSMGIVQFSSNARTEHALTSNVTAVLAKFKEMQQMEQLTYFDKGLSLCKSNLDSAESRRESFDICVLITDGIDLSNEPPAALQALVPSDTAIFGIFVGSDSRGISLLKKVTACGKANSSKHQCRFFAAASDYTALSSKADEVAGEVTRAVDLAMCAVVSALIGVPTAICMCLPYILWYASCTGLTLWRRRNSNNNSNNKKAPSLPPIEDAPDANFSGEQAAE